MMSDSDEEKPQQPDSQAQGANEGERPGASRREFIKKVAYVAPVIETFLLSETAYASGGSGGIRGRGRGRGRGRRRISPAPNDRRVPPPPPGRGDDDDD